MEDNRRDEKNFPENEEGTRIDILKAACLELFPKFVEAGTSKCAVYVRSLLFNKLLPKASARRRKIRR